MPPSNKLNKKCTPTSNSTPKLMQKSWLFQLSKVSKLNLKSSQVDTAHQQLKLGFMKMDVPYKLLPVIIWVKTLPKCSVLSFKMKRRKRNWFGKQVGDSPPDPSV